jgi:uncharacterized protein (TIGR01319 family)
VPVVVCVDVGSTWTKGAAVDVVTGELIAAAAHPTTIRGDVMTGIAAVRSRLAEVRPATSDAPAIACSSAGGGLRLAVVGYERAVTAEAGRRVGLSAGARVVHVSAGALSPDSVTALVEDRPDLVLLVGGTDGGNADVLVRNADELARARLGIPVVVAGNADARDLVVARLRRSRVSTVPASNVLPRIGVLDPLPARAAIREMFIRHVIGGKHLSSSAEFAGMVRAATPDAVLTGVEMLADGAAGLPGAGDVLVIDVGGATTDVYSVTDPSADEAGAHREVVEVMWRARTVEGDLGVRWSAPGVVDAASAERLIDPAEAAALIPAAVARAADPDLVPADAAGQAIDARLAELALVVAARRHARPHESGDIRIPGRDLSRVRIVVGSGGVLRHAADDVAYRLLAAVRDDGPGGWKLPVNATLALDASYVLAAAGLLATDYPEAASRLVSGCLVPVSGTGMAASAASAETPAVARNAARNENRSDRLPATSGPAKVPASDDI